MLINNLINGPHLLPWINPKNTKNLTTLSIPISKYHFSPIFCIKNRQKYPLLIENSKLFNLHGPWLIYPKKILNHFNTHFLILYHVASLSSAINLCKVFRIGPIPKPNSPLIPNLSAQKADKRAFPQRRRKKWNFHFSPSGLWMKIQIISRSNFKEPSNRIYLLFESYVPNSSFWTIACFLKTTQVSRKS